MDLSEGTRCGLCLGDLISDEPISCCAICSARTTSGISFLWHDACFDTWKNPRCPYCHAPLDGKGWWNLNKKNVWNCIFAALSAVISTCIIICAIREFRIAATTLSIVYYSRGALFSFWLKAKAFRIACRGFKWMVSLLRKRRHRRCVMAVLLAAVGLSGIQLCRCRTFLALYLPLAYCYWFAIELYGSYKNVFTSAAVVWKLPWRRSEVPQLCHARVATIVGV